MRQRWVYPLLLSLVLTGCWDRREIEERSTSLATGVDVCAENEGCNLLSTRQIAIPGRIPLGSEKDGGGGGAKDTVFVISSPGNNGPDSLRKGQASLHRKISLAHSRIVVMSEAFCRRGTAEYVDYLRRIPELRRLMWIAVSEGRADEVIRARPALEQVPALFLNDLMDEAVKTGRMPKVFIGEFLTRMSNKGEEALAPLIRMEGPDRPSLSGLAVFRGDRMVGKLDSEEMATLMEVQGVRRGSERINVDMTDQGRAVLVVYGRSTRYRLTWTGGNVVAHITIELESDLGELTPGLRGSDPEALQAIERQASETVRRRAEALVQKLQSEYRSDILGFGERVRAHLPKAWATIDDWPSAFAQTRFSFDVTVRVRRGGMSTD